MTSDRTIGEEQLKRARGEYVGFRRKVDFLENPLQGKLYFGDVGDSDLRRVGQPDRREVHYISVGHFRGPQKYIYPGHDGALKLGGAKHREHDGCNIPLEAGDEIELFSIGSYRPGREGWYTFDSKSNKSE